MELSRISASALPSATLSLNADAKRLKRQGEDVVMFTVGEPDFDTPENIKQAAHLAIQGGHTKYTPTSGTPELREAVCRKFLRDNGLSYEPNQVVASNGAKQVLYMVMLSILDPEDEVILAAPYWVSYAEQARYCGAAAVAVDCTSSPGLKLTPELLKNAITPRSKLLVLNSPCNPSGGVYTEAELRALVEVAPAHDLWIISDEVYEFFIYDGAVHHSPAGFGDDAYSRVITVNSVSKTYAMTGWRIGYAAGPKEVIEAAGRLQGNISSAPNSIAQKAAIEALDGPQDSVQEMRRAFQERRDFIVESLNSMAGIQCPVPQGAFYAYPDVSALFGKKYGGRAVEDSAGLCTALLDASRFAAIPGSAFGTEGYLRLSYATELKSIEKGMERLAQFLETAEG